MAETDTAARRAYDDQLVRAQITQIFGGTLSEYRRQRAIDLGAAVGISAETVDTELHRY